MRISIQQPLSICELGARQNQEDSLFPLQGEATLADRLFLLCDGMGGHEHGEVASQLVCSVLSDHLLSHWQPMESLSDELLRDALDEVFRRINEQDDGSQRQMGTTLTLLCLHQGGVTMAHLGDSRIYHLRPADHLLLYKSRDHSLVYDLFMAGEITREEMENYPRKNVITRAIIPGLERQPKLDIVHTTDVQPGDLFFLCSDGMLERMDDDALAALLCADKPLASKRQQLIEATALNADNHSAWLLQVDDVQREPLDGSQPHNENTSRCNALLLERPQQPETPESLSLWQKIKKHLF